jgi:hypothetical protein
MHHHLNTPHESFRKIVVLGQALTYSFVITDEDGNQVREEAGTIPSMTEGRAFSHFQRLFNCSPQKQIPSILSENILCL